MSTIAITATSPALQARAQQLATELNLPIAESNTEQFELLLLVTPDYIALQQNTKPATNPIYIDFLAGKNAWRQKTGGQELLAKAVGVKGNYKPSVIDTTAGLGRDAFVLANLGCQVTMLERSPIMGLLLQDGLTRLQAASAAMTNFQLVQHDAITYLEQLTTAKPDVVYLDPMYPHRTKTALVKKEMRMLRTLVGEDNDALALCRAALQAAGKRVVVKRPRLAEALVAKPDIVFKGSNSRFDMYLIK